MTTADARRIVEGAKLAEDAFPSVVSGASLQAAFRELALLLHPDRAGAASEALMARLNALRDEAERKLAAGTWGKRAPAKTGSATGALPSTGGGAATRL